MKIGCCVDLSYYDHLVRAGYDCITLSASAMAAWSDDTFEEARRKLAGGPLALHSLNGFGKPGLRLTGADMDLAAIEAYARTILKRGSMLGATYLGIGAPDGRSVRPGERKEAALRQLGDVLRLLSELAAPWGMEILLEPVCTVECNLVTTLREGLALIEPLGCPNLHLVCDIFHEFMMGQPPQSAASMVGEIKVVHIARHVGGKRFYLDASTAPLCRDYWQALARAGYDGEFSVEAMEGDPALGIARSMDILRPLNENTAQTQKSI